MADKKLSEKVTENGLAAAAELTDVFAAIRSTADVNLSIQLLKTLLLVLNATDSGLLMSATDKILGRSTAGAGAIEEIACTALGRTILAGADAATVRAAITAAGSGVNSDITEMLASTWLTMPAGDWSEYYVNFHLNATPTGITFGNNGGAGAAANATSTTPTSTVGRQMAFLTAGTTTTGIAYLTSGANLFAGGLCGIRYQSKVYIPIVPTAGEDYILDIGLGDNVATGEQVDAIGCRIERAAHATNWLRYTSSNSARTKNSSGIAFVAGWNTIEFDVNAAGTSVSFRINGSDAGSETTNIPTTFTRAFTLLSKIEKIAGTTARTTFIPHLYIRFY